MLPFVTIRTGTPGGVPRCRKHFGHEQSRSADAASVRRDLAELSDERTRIERQLESCVRDERELVVRVREDGIDEEERSEEEHEIGLTDRLRELAARRLAGIDRALAHAAGGVLTLCDVCGGDIPLARLRALPGTTCCLACAQEKENRS